jgi:hypothetical protein
MEETMYMHYVMERMRCSLAKLTKASLDAYETLQHIAEPTPPGEMRHVYSDLASGALPALRSALEDVKGIVEENLDFGKIIQSASYNNVTLEKLQEAINNLLPLYPQHLCIFDAKNSCLWICKILNDNGDARVVHKVFL